MKVGDLVSIERASVGIAKGTLAMITERARQDDYPRKHAAFSVLFHVEIIGSPRNGFCPLRYFSDDMKVIHAA